MIEHFTKYAAKIAKQTGSKRAGLTGDQEMTEQTLKLKGYTLGALSDCVEKMRRWRIYDEVNYGLHKTILRLQEQAECAPSDDAKMYIYASAIMLVTRAIERIEYGERDDE